MYRERKKLRNQRNWRKKKKSSLVPISPFCNSCCPPFSIQLMDMCTIYQILVYVCLPFCQTDALNEQLTFSPFWNPVIRQSMEIIWLFQCILLIGHFYLSFLAFLWLPFNVKLLFAKFKKCLIDSVLYFSYFYTYIFLHLIIDYLFNFHANVNKDDFVVFFIESNFLELG